MRESNRFVAMVGCCLISLQLSAAEPTARVNVIVKERAEVSEAMAYLSDIVNMDRVLPQYQPRFKTIDIAKLDNVGDIKVVRAAQIKYRLFLEGIPIDHIQMGGRETVQVVRVKHSSLRSVLETQLQAKVARAIGVSVSDLELDITSLTLPVEVLKGDQQVSVDVISSSRASGGTFRATAKITESDIVVKSFSVSGRATVFAEQAVTSRLVTKGEVLSADNVIGNRIPLSSKDGYVTVSDVVGRRVSRTLGRDQIIKVNDIDIKPQIIIKRRDTVNMLYEGASFRVLVRGQAMADGHMGQRIEVRSITGGKTVMGIVQGPALVRVR